jgi:hypothetical protein
MIAWKASNGCAPERNLPLMKNAGVPVTPSDPPCRKSFSTASRNFREAKHWPNAPVSSRRSDAN